MNSIDGELMKKCAQTNNCNVGFPQPGYASGYGHFPDKHIKGCTNMVSRLWGDNPDVKPIDFHQKCPNKTSKIALIVDPKRDYHFVRQDSDGTWSHKPGAMDVTTLDASGRPIIRPDRALFVYKNHKDPLQYTKFCGYHCVPRGKSLYLMTTARGGSLRVQKGDFAFSLKPTRGRLTRRKSRGDLDLTN